MKQLKEIDFINTNPYMDPHVIAIVLEPIEFFLSLGITGEIIHWSPSGAYGLGFHSTAELEPYIKLNKFSVISKLVRMVFRLGFSYSNKTWLEKHCPTLILRIIKRCKVRPLKAVDP